MRNREKILYHCKYCKATISWHSALYGKGGCVSCSQSKKHVSKETKLKISKANSGRQHSEETKLKMSKAKKGNTSRIGTHHSKETKAKIGKAHIGKIVSKETRLKMSKAKRGKNNSSYIHGQSKRKYFPIFYKLAPIIRNRDKHNCQICKIKEINCKRLLSVHHIDYNKENNNLNNLISLCQPCHIKTNGNHKLDRNYWFVYCQYLMDKTDEKI